MVNSRYRNLADCVIIFSDKDNVVTALVDLPAGEYMFGTSEKQTTFIIRENIKAGFKVALSDIRKGESIYKYGYVIGLATENIEKGRCVHVHNLISSV